MPATVTSMVTFTDPFELDEVERHLKYLVHRVSFETKRKRIFLNTILLNGAAEMLHTHPFVTLSFNTHGKFYNRGIEYPRSL